ncbi:hypothetical protein L6R50_18420 [Myxococcota bacterium]|nr:hypothetical protein [Myxococcota bacterium]
MTAAILRSTGAALSPHYVGPDDALRLLPGSDTRVVHGAIGLRGRYWSTDPETGKVAPDQTTSHLAARAVDDAIRRWGGDRRQVDCLVVTTCTPETELPQTSARVQHILGLHDLRLLDLRSGCAGVVQALNLARLMIEAGEHRTVVVAGADCFSPVNLPRVLPPASRSVEDLMDTLMLSDLGAAAVVSAGEPDQPRRLTWGLAGSPLPDVDPGLITEPLMPVSRIPGTAAGRRREAFVRVVNNHELIRRYLPEVIQHAFHHIHRVHGLGWLDFEAVVGPQANPGLIRTVHREVAERNDDAGNDHGDRKPWFIGDRFGNCPGCAILHAYHELDQAGRVHPGDRVLLLGAESPKWLYATAMLQA